MCLKIKSGPHTAKKDFYTLKLAYRVTEKDSVSFYREVKQSYGKKLRAKFTHFVNSFGVTVTDTIKTGLHSILVGKASKIVSGYSFDYGMAEKGVILCKVPKGATYYLGQENDVVSDKLILVEPLIVCSSNIFSLEENIGYVETTNQAFVMASDIVNKLELNIIPS